MRDLTGARVEMKIRYAKWLLDHPDVYEYAGNVDDSYESETLVNLVCCLGEPVRGTVLNSGNLGCWLVRFKIMGIALDQYMMTKDFTVL